MFALENYRVELFVFREFRARGRDFDEVSVMRAGYLFNSFYVFGLVKARLMAVCDAAVGELF